MIYPLIQQHNEKLVCHFTNHFLLHDMSLLVILFIIYLTNRIFLKAQKADCYKIKQKQHIHIQTLFYNQFYYS